MKEIATILNDRIRISKDLDRLKYRDKGQKVKLIGAKVKFYIEVKKNSCTNSEVGDMA